MDAAWPYLTAILPTILVSILFYYLIRSMIEGDRRERLAQKRFESEEDARIAARATTSGATDRHPEDADNASRRIPPPGPDIL